MANGAPPPPRVLEPTAPPDKSDTKGEAPKQWNAIEASGASSTKLKKHMHQSYRFATACAIARHG